MKPKSTFLFLVLLWISTIGALAQNSYLNDPFDTDPLLSSLANENGKWYVDRYAPAIFDSEVLGSENVLRIHISPADGAQNRPSSYSSSFYNTQGRKFNQDGLNATILKGDLYLPADWATKHRRSDMWASGFKADNITIGSYPIIGFRNVDGTSPTFSYWDDVNGWINFATPSVYNTWYNFEIKLVENQVKYYMNGALVGTISAYDAVSIGNVIMQAYNFNDANIALPATTDNSIDNSYDAYWDNVITQSNIYNATQNSYYASIQAAVFAANANDVINVAAGTYEFTAQMNIDKEGISINGQGNVIFKANNAAWSTVNGYKHLIGIYAGTSSNPVTISNITMNCNSQCFGLNTYSNANGTLNNVTVNGSKGAALTVNGSTIIATNLNTASNAWGAVNVDPGSGVTTPSVFTLNSGTLAENTQIWSDGSHVAGPATVTVNATGYNIYNVGEGKIWTNRALTNCATITKSGETTIYNTIQAAIDAATVGDVIDVAAGTYAENLVVNKALTLKGANFNTACGERSAESIIAPATGLPVSITADGVVLNGFEITAPAYQYAVVFGNRSNVSVFYNNIHDIGTTVTGTNVHAINYTVANSSNTENINISNNCLDGISSSSLTGYSAAAIGILQSTSTGVLTGLTIENNAINNVNVNTGNWPTGKLAYGIVINVGSGSYLTTAGKVVNATVKGNTITNLSGFIATAIGMEGNTENAVVQNNIVSNLTAYKLADRNGGGYDMSGLKFETNKYIGTVLVSGNVFNTNTFVHNGTANKGYAVSNYVPSASGVANVSCNWFGTANASEIADNATLTGKIFNKSGCETLFLPFSTSASPTNCAGVGPVVNTTKSLSYMTIQAAIDAATAGDVINVAAGTFTENINLNKRVSIIGAGSGEGGTILTQTSAGAGDTKIGVVQLNASGLSAEAPVLIKDLRIQPVGMAGISVGRFTEATATTVGYLKFENVYVIGTNTNPSTEQERGFYVDNSSTANNLEFINCAFNNLTYGWYFQKMVSADASNVSNVTITNTLFNHNNHKGIYAEKLSNATITNCTFDQNGMDAAVLPSYFAPWSCGLDVNLKAGVYSNISITGCTITNNGTGGAKEGAGATIKARSDGGSYGAYPATLTDVTITGCTITGNERGIRFGEPDKNNPQPFNVILSNNTINNNRKHYTGTDGTDYGDVVNMLNNTVTLNSQTILAGQNVWYVNDGESIQAVVNAARAGDVIHVGAGTYPENLSIGKSLTILGPNANISPNGEGRIAEAILQPLQGFDAIIPTANDINVVMKGIVVDMASTVEGNRYLTLNSKSNTGWTFEKNIFKNAEYSVNGSWWFSGSTVSSLTLNDNYFYANAVSNGLMIAVGCPALSITNNVWEDNGYTALNLNNVVGAISGNVFRDTRSVDLLDPNYYFGDYQSGILLASANNNLNISGNTFTNVHYGIVLYQSADGSISITDNDFEGTLIYSIRLSSSQPGGDLNDVAVNGNSFVNYAGSSFEINNARTDGQVLDATCNWYGTTVASEVAAKISTAVEFLPFSSSASPINCTGYGPVVVYEGTTTNVRSSHMTIQEGIDVASVGDVITVAAGTYTEQLHITTNNLTLQGASKSTVTLKSPASLPLYYTSGTNQNHPIVFVDGVNAFTLKDMTVDGDGKGNANYRFQGISFWNAGGAVLNVDVTNIMDTPFSGSQHGIAVSAHNNTNGPYNLSCTNMVIDEYQKNGMALSGVGLTVALDNITTIGAGPTSVTAQNGIQVAYGAGGTIANSNVSGNIYTGEGWSSAGILLYQGSSVAITNTTISDNYTGLDVNDCSGSITNSTVLNQNIDSWDGIYLRKYQNTPMTFDVTGVNVMGHNKADSWGIYVKANTGTIEADITQCQVSNWGLGVYTREATGGVVNVLTNNNVISNNTDGYYANTVTPQIATLNYWGTCPSISGLAIYFPYWSTVSGTPGAFTFGGQINNITAAATNASVCAGSSTTIFATGGSDYLWDNGLGLGASKVVSPATTTPYNVTSKDANGCAGAFASVEVTVNDAPEVTIASASVTGGTQLTASGATTYVWNTGSTANPYVVAPTSTTTYSVIGTTDGCTGTASTVVTVVTVSAGSNQVICNGGSATLTATVGGVASPVYAWSPGGATTQSITVSPTATTPYTVTVSGVSSTATVFVNPKPIANAGPDKTLVGAGVILEGSASGGSAPYSYLWSPGGMAVANPMVSAANAYNLVVTDAFGCQSDADQVVVSAPAANTYTVSGNIAYAFGTVNPQMHDVEVKLVGTAGTYTGYTAATGNGDYAIPGVPAGTYTVYLNSPKAWGGVTSTDITAIQNHYRPRNPVLLHGIKRLAADVVGNSSAHDVDANDRDEVNKRRIGQISAFATGDWVFTKAGDISSTTYPISYAYTAATGFSNITVEVVNANVTGQDYHSLCYGDVNASYTGLKILETEEPIVHNANGEDWFELTNYPNPFNGQTTISFYQPVDGQATIQVYDLTGNRVGVINNQAVNEGEHKLTFDGQGLAPGVYFYVLTLETSDDVMSQTGKMVIYK